MALRMAVGVVIYKYHGRSDVPLGSGRTSQGLFGQTLNTLGTGGAGDTGQHTFLLAVVSADSICEAPLRVRHGLWAE